MLYVVATPIGNLSDMSPRAIETLKNVDLICAEDTRVTKKLTNHFGIDTPLISCHQHNEKSRGDEITNRMLEENLDVAVVTDAGTPAISDPGTEIVRLAAEKGIPVAAVAGPSACIAAVSVSGFDFSAFTLPFSDGFGLSFEPSFDSLRNCSVSTCILPFQRRKRGSFISSSDSNPSPITSSVSVTSRVSTFE